MSEVGFIEEYLDNANKFYELAMNQFDLYLKLMGTDVIVLRAKEDSKHKEVFGATYSSDLKGDDTVEKFKYRIIINLNDMHKVFSRAADSFEVVDNRDVLKLGDVVIYQRGSMEFKFKITDYQAFSSAANVLYRYTLQGYQEIESL